MRPGFIQQTTPQRSTTRTWQSAQRALNYDAKLFCGTHKEDEEKEERVGVVFERETDSDEILLSDGQGGGASGSGALQFDRWIVAYNTTTHSTICYISYWNTGKSINKIYS